MNIERSVTYFAMEIGRYLVAGNCFSRWAGRMFVAMGLLTTLLLNGTSFAQTSPVVYVVPIEGIIDLGLASFEPLPPQSVPQGAV